MQLEEIALTLAELPKKDWDGFYAALHLFLSKNAIALVASIHAAYIIQDGGDENAVTEASQKHSPSKGVTQHDRNTEGGSG